MLYKRSWEGEEMEQFDYGEICEVWSNKLTYWLDCEIICLPGDTPDGYPKPAPGHVISIPGHPSGKLHGYWTVEARYLRKKKPPKETKDITETREKGAPVISDPDHVDWARWAGVPEKVVQ